MKQAGGKYQFARHSQLGVPQGPFRIFVCNLLVHEIHRYRPPVSSQVVEQKSRNSHLSTAIEEPSIVFQVTSKNLSPHTVIRFAVSNRGRFKKQKNSTRCVGV